MLLPKYIIRHELIGLSIEITESKNPSLIGLKGKIIDETQNTITVQNKKSTKNIIKNQIKMKIKLNQKEVIIDGNNIVGRPYERLKK